MKRRKKKKKKKKKNECCGLREVNILSKIVGE